MLIQSSTSISPASAVDLRRSSTPCFALSLADPRRTPTGLLSGHPGELHHPELILGCTGWSPVSPGNLSPSPESSPTTHQRIYHRHPNPHHPHLPFWAGKLGSRANEGSEASGGLGLSAAWARRHAKFSGPSSRAWLAGTQQHSSHRRSQGVFILQPPLLSAVSVCRDASNASDESQQRAGVHGSTGPCKSHGTGCQGHASEPSAATQPLCC